MNTIQSRLHDNFEERMMQLLQRGAITRSEYDRRLDTMINNKMRLQRSTLSGHAIQLDIC